MCLTERIFAFFNNASVAAFAGAFAAFFLVALTDIRRKRGRIKLILRRIGILSEIAHKKLEAVQSNISLIRDTHQFTPAPYMKFPAEDLRVLQREALEILTATQINAIDALIFWMESIDDLLNDVTSCAERLLVLVKADAAKSELDEQVAELMKLLEQAETNLGYLVELEKYYLDGTPEKILEFRHPFVADGNHTSGRSA